MTRYSSMAPVRAGFAPLAILALSLVATASAADPVDPPGRVAQVNYLEGSGSMQAAGTDTWIDAVLNRPLTGGDRLWIDERSRAEMHVGSTALRLGSRTAVQILAVDDHHVRLSMTAGSMSVHIRALDSDDRFDIETPAGVVSLRQPGGYRLDVDDVNARGFLAVWSGRAEVSGPSGSTSLRDDQSAELVPGADPAVDTATAGNIDSLDQWAQDRDQGEDQSVAADYVSRDMVGYQDLDGYGQWMAEPDYGVIWVPTVPVGWAPYHYGYWNWIGPWGWTWIASEPWGFAPCHYGRWVYVNPYGWAWVPGPRNGPAPVYAPALVAWRGEHNPRTSPGPEVRPKVGWVPLGYNEPYKPPFHASPNYLRASNLSNTHLGRGEVNRFIDDEQHGGVARRYANDNVAGAYSAVPREAFAAANAFGPPRAVAEQTTPPQERYSPRAAWRVTPADRPVAHPALYTPAVAVDRPPARANARTRSESTPKVDRPQRPTPILVARAQPAARAMLSYRDVQPMSGGSESRRVYYYAGPPSSGGGASASGAREAHRSAVHVERRP